MGIVASGVARSEIFITSKLWNTQHNPEDVEAACRKSLADLGVEYLDLYLIHWPVAFQRGDNMFPRNEDGTVKYDTEIHPTTTWLAMEKLVEKGLTKSIGLSNFNSEQIADVLAKTPFSTEFYSAYVWIRLQRFGQTSSCLWTLI